MPTPTRPRPAQPDTTRTRTEDALWAALRARPSRTCAELAAVAHIGRSTAGKILARWADQQLVTRTTAPATGTSGRTPDRWTISRTDDPIDPALNAADAAGDDTAADDTAGDDTAADAQSDGAAAGRGPRGRREPTAYGAAGAGREDSARPTGAAERGPTPTPSLVPAPVPTQGRGISPTSPSGRSTVSTAGLRRRRLPAGGLRGLVEDYLRDHPGQAVGPGQIGKELGRSSGAVANALVKLVEAGCAAITQDRPRRYTLITDANARALGVSAPRDIP